MTHQTRRPQRPDWRERTQTRVTKHEYYCWRGEHWYELEQADYCDDCGNFFCAEHGHDCGFAQRAKD